MKEYELDKTTLMGAWFISKKLCNDITKKMKNQPLKDGDDVNETSNEQVIDKT